MNGQDITIYGDGTQQRSFSYIDDSLQPLFNAAIEPKASKQIINLGGIHEYSINEAADTLIDVMGGGNKIYLEGRHEVHTAIPSYQKSIDILGFDHKTDLKDGLTKMWLWAQEQPKRDRFVWSDYELDNGIYSFWKQ
jgi:UDP-glucose 4-epimerase